MKKYSPHIQAQIDKAGGFEAYRKKMRDVRSGVGTISSNVIDEIIRLKEKGVTQDDIAGLIGISQSSVSVILRKIAKGSRG